MLNPDLASCGMMLNSRMDGAEKKTNVDGNGLGRGGGGTEQNARNTHTTKQQHKAKDKHAVD